MNPIVPVPQGIRPSFDPSYQTLESRTHAHVARRSVLPAPLDTDDGFQKEREKALEELGISVERDNVGVHTPKRVCSHLSRQRLY